MVALKLSSMRGAEVASSSSRCQRACVARPGSSSRRSVALRAAAEDGAVSTSNAMPPVLVWPQDNETARDIFAFAGPLPERLNGRMAMLGFAGVALAEIKSGVPAAEQLSGDVGGILLLMSMFTLASIFPKFVSGSSLKDLHAAATTDNLKASSGIGQVLGLFDTNLELWTGRVAMIGFAGLLVVEGITGKVLL